jgi:polyphosphate kinase 2
VNGARYFGDHEFAISVSSAQAYLSAAASGMMALTGIVFAMAPFGAIAYSPGSRCYERSWEEEMAATKSRSKVRKTKDQNSPAIPDKLGNKVYLRELARLHGELVKLQLWAVAKGLKAVVIFEGRDGAGKGGVIKAITERVSPRVFRVVALPAPTEREKSQMYLQRYVRHLPAAGEIMIFDRSWYNRAGVERVMEFCTLEQAKRFLELTPAFEKTMVESGIQLIKYWLEVSEEEQTRRLEARISDSRKIWKLSPMDLKSYSRWYDYSRARDDMFKATDTPWAPWHVVRSDDKKQARLNVIAHLLSQVPHEELSREEPVLPKRQKPHGYVEPDYPYKIVPELAWSDQ